MLYQSIATIFTFALAATASPLEKRATPGQQFQDQKCGQQLTAKCCNSVQNTLFGLIQIPVGIQCTLISLVNVQALNDQCSGTVACCQSGDQAGLVNVGNVCPIIG
ncbi:MAG: hypothetical protein M1817_004104 [Caeruleum heppii]|nr:MAG: hypothetical protein M1817_004104 [Caeruleum heppii]